MSEVPTIRESKKMLRQEMKLKLKEQPAQERASASLLIHDLLLSSPWWENARHAALFIGREDEPQISFLIDDARREHRHLLLPRVTGDDLDFFAVTKVSDLMTGAFGLPEPDPLHCRQVPPSEIDLMLVPGLAFNLQGHRLGRGRGYYDRYMALPGFQAKKIGLFFSFQQVDKIPTEDHDGTLDAMITEHGILNVPDKT